MKADFCVQFNSVRKYPELHFDGTYDPASEIIHLYGELADTEVVKLINFFESYGAKVITWVEAKLFYSDEYRKDVALEFDTSNMDRLEIN